MPEPTVVRATVVLELPGGVRHTHTASVERPHAGGSAYSPKPPGMDDAAVVLAQARDAVSKAAGLDEHIEQRADEMRREAVAKFASPYVTETP